MDDTPDKAKRARLRQLVTVGSTLVRQRDSFVGKLTNRERSLRHRIESSARRYRDEAIDKLMEHPELRDMVVDRNFARLRDAFPVSWPLRKRT
jgi:hypothetical protein